MPLLPRINCMHWLYDSCASLLSCSPVHEGHPTSVLYFGRCRHPVCGRSPEGASGCRQGSHFKLRRCFGWSGQTWKGCCRNLARKPPGRPGPSQPCWLIRYLHRTSSKFLNYNLELNQILPICFCFLIAQICKNVEMFGVSVEKLLIKHGKHIINEQFLLNRLAQSAIDIYISTCMVSRCSQSLTNNLSSARHEELMTKV